jgi:site-specific DNA-methyltransferase (adenine-specific)
MNVLDPGNHRPRDPRGGKKGRRPMTNPRIEHIAEGVTLYLGDCLEVLPTLAGIDAIVTDPPYGVGIEYASYSDGLDATTEMVKDFVAIASANARVVAFTGGKYETWVALFKELPPRWVMVWFKGAQSTASPIGFNDWEPIFVYGQKVHNNAHDYFYAMPEPMGNYGHPCPKPVAYSRTLIDRLHKPDGGAVCDPFLGSGTSGVAAVNLGRKFIGIEKDPGYFDIACKRVSAALNQQDFFIEKPKPKQLSMLGKR